MVNEGKKDSEISMSFRIKNQNTYVTIYKEFQNIGYNFILEGRLFHRSTLECTKVLVLYTVSTNFSFTATGEQEVGQRLSKSNAV